MIGNNGNDNVRIRFYGYNTFLMEAGGKKIAIDPGATFFPWFRFRTLIPKSEWADLSHAFVTHGDPDHYWHMDRIAEAHLADTHDIPPLIWCKA